MPKLANKVIKKILFIDDDPAVVKLAELALLDEDIEVDSFICPESVFFINKLKDYYAIFIDHKMPLIEGSKVASILRDSGFKNPIYIVSNYDRSDVMKDISSLGIKIDGFIDKYDYIEQIKRVVKNV